MDDFPALHRAARRGDLTAVEALLAASADVEEHTPEGCTALTLAAENGHATIIRAVAAAHADVARTSGTEPYAWGGETLLPPLHWAALGLHLGAVEALLALRADGDARDSHGFAALHMTGLMGADAVVDAVFAARAQVDAATTKTASTWWSGTCGSGTPTAKRQRRALRSWRCLRRGARQRPGAVTYRAWGTHLQPLRTALDDAIDRYESPGS